MFYKFSGSLSVLGPKSVPGFQDASITCGTVYSFLLYSPAGHPCSSFIQDVSVKPISNPKKSLCHCVFLDLLKNKWKKKLTEEEPLFSPQPAKLRLGGRNDRPREAFLSETFLATECQSLSDNMSKHTCQCEGSQSGHASTSPTYRLFK